MADQTFALSEVDCECIAELTKRAADSSSSGLVSWWSESRRILWLRLFVAGKPGPWMMVPAEDPAAAARQREAFGQLIGIQLEINELIAHEAPLQ